MNWPLCKRIEPARGNDMVYRGIAVVAGVMILAAAAHVTIEHTGGYNDPRAFLQLAPHAVLTLAIATGVAIGAVIIGKAWSHGRKGIAVCIALALICGESFGLLRTAERLVEDRAIKAAPLAEAQDKRNRAQAALAAALAKQQSIPDVSRRLQNALNAQRDAQSAIAESAAKRGCARNCRALLQDAVDKASAETVAARKAIDDQRRDAQAKVEAAQAALAAIKPTRSPSALADVLQVQPWLIDLTIAALGAIGANGLGAALLAFGGHAPVPRRRHAVDLEARVVSSKKKVANDHDHIKDFAMSRLVPDDTGTATFEAMAEAYTSWCRAERIEALPLDRAAQLFAELVNHLELPVENRNGDPVVRGLSVRNADLKLIEAA